MKKKILLTLTTVFLCLFALGLTASAAIYGSLTYKVENGEVTITDCNESATSVTVPETINGYPVTSIGERAFHNCSSLTSIDVSENNRNYSSENGVLFDKEKKTIIKYPAKKSDTSYIIPDSVTSIGYEAFYGCSSLESIELSDSVTSIGNWAFSGCSSLTSIDVSENNRNYSSENGVLFDKEKKTIIKYPAKKSDTSYIIPDSVTSIGYEAFSGCSSLKTVYYHGTEERWNNIKIGKNNDNLTGNVIFVKHTKTDVSLDGKTFVVTPIYAENGETVILALFDGDSFIGMQSAVCEGEEITFVTDKEYTMAKVMVWDDLESMKPAGESEIVK